MKDADLKATHPTTPAAGKAEGGFANGTTADAGAKTVELQRSSEGFPNLNT